MTGGAARRAIFATLPVAAVVCVAAALAAAVWLERPLARFGLPALKIAALLMGIAIASYVARQRRRGEANFLMMVTAGWMLGALAALAALGVSWSIAAFMGSSAAPALLPAAALVLIGSMIVQLALKSAANIQSAIRGPAVRT